MLCQANLLLKPYDILKFSELEECFSHHTLRGNRNPENREAPGTHQRLLEAYVTYPTTEVHTRVSRVHPVTCFESFWPHLPKMWLQRPSVTIGELAQLGIGPFAISLCRLFLEHDILTEENRARAKSL